MLDPIPPWVYMNSIFEGGWFSLSRFPHLHWDVGRLWKVHIFAYQMSKQPCCILFFHEHTLWPLFSLIMTYHSNDLKEMLEGCAIICLFFQNNILIFNYIHCFLQGFNCPFACLVWVRNSIWFSCLLWLSRDNFCFCCWLAQQSTSSSMKYIWYHGWMLHASPSLQLVGGVRFEPTRNTHFNLQYTSQEFKKLVKFGCFKSAWFCNSYV